MSIDLTAFLLFTIMLFTIRRCQAKLRTNAELVQLITSGAYDRYERPNTSKRDEQVVVSIAMEMNSLLAVDERNQEILLDITMRSTWYDNRLRFPFDELKKEVRVESDDYDKIWYPGIYFPSATSRQALHKDTYMKIRENGKVSSKQRIILKLRCPFNYTFFPFDEQECRIKAELFTYKYNEVILAPLEDPDAFILRSKYDVTKDAFNITHIAVKACMANITAADRHCLAFHLRLERSITQATMYNFIPPGLLVLLGYISFYLNHSASNVRALVLVIVTLLVALHSTGFYLTMDRPDVAYLTPGDIWRAICIIMISLAFATFVIVERLCEKPQGLELPTDTKRRRFGLILDSAMKIVYPVIFAGASAAYYLTFLGMRNKPSIDEISAIEGST